jgi:hypothetical protein
MNLNVNSPCLIRRSDSAETSGKGRKSTSKIFKKKELL